LSPRVTTGVCTSSAANPVYARSVGVLYRVERIFYGIDVVSLPETVCISDCSPMTENALFKCASHRPQQ
jgi:hypothetical protein